MADTLYRPRASEYTCPRCNIPFHGLAHRAWYYKLLFAKRPVRRFFCAQCLKKYYVKVTIPTAEEVAAYNAGEYQQR